MAETRIEISSGAPSWEDPPRSGPRVVIGFESGNAAVGRVARISISKESERVREKPLDPFRITLSLVTREQWEALKNEVDNAFDNFEKHVTERSALIRALVDERPAEKSYFERLAAESGEESKVGGQ